MKIQQITFELGHDFHAIMECEHCGHTQKMNHGYHDEYFHCKVIPDMLCQNCNRNREGQEPDTVPDLEFEYRINP